MKLVNWEGSLKAAMNLEHLPPVIGRRLVRGSPWIPCPTFFEGMVDTTQQEQVEFVRFYPIFSRDPNSLGHQPATPPTPPTCAPPPQRGHSENLRIRPLWKPSQVELRLTSLAGDVAEASQRAAEELGQAF